MIVNKSFITNFVAFLLVIISFLLPENVAKYFLNAGLFALSGSVTNQLAIYMLFERVPYLYGSGIILDRFEAFKDSIKNMMMNQFFTKEQLNSFFASEEKKLDLTPIIEKTDLTPAFEALSSSVMESKFGGMIAMFGGVAVIDSLKDPFITKMRASIISIVQSQNFQKVLENELQNSRLSDDMLAAVETLIDRRLNELTPVMVKDLVYELISLHLGWLVVWGGVLGGIIGVVSSVLM